jgi:crossover junction endodeoxyribonuclease RuvC
MLQQTLGIKMEIDRFDASDALAVALCHHYQFRSTVTAGKKLSGWGEFLTKNPGRII